MLGGGEGEVEEYVFILIGGWEVAGTTDNRGQWRWCFGSWWQLAGGMDKKHLGCGHMRQTSGRVLVPFICSKDRRGGEVNG
jgi:hypothetical protein